MWDIFGYLLNNYHDIIIRLFGVYKYSEVRSQYIVL